MSDEPHGRAVASYVVFVIVDYNNELKWPTMSGKHEIPIAYQILDSHRHSGLSLSLLNTWSKYQQSYKA